MKSITLQNKDGQKIEIGTNNSGEGIFARRKDGTWAQWAGNGKACGFHTPQQLRRYLARHYDEYEIGSGWRMIDNSFQD